MKKIEKSQSSVTGRKYIAEFLRVGPKFWVYWVDTQIIIIVHKWTASMTQSLEARPIVWKIVIRKYCDKGITISHWQFKKRLLFFSTQKLKNFWNSMPWLQAQLQCIVKTRTWDINIERGKESCTLIKDLPWFQKCRERQGEVFIDMFVEWAIDDVKFNAEKC